MSRWVAPPLPAHIAGRKNNQPLTPLRQQSRAVAAVAQKTAAVPPPATGNRRPAPSAFRSQQTHGIVQSKNNVAQTVVAPGTVTGVKRNLPPLVPAPSAASRPTPAQMNATRPQMATRQRTPVLAQTPSPPLAVSRNPLAAPRVIPAHDFQSKALQPKMSTSQSKISVSQFARPQIAQARPPAATFKQYVLQRHTSGIVQATKFYPNLHPGAAVPVDRSNIFSLDSFANQYRLHRVGTHSVNVPNMKYNFVRTREGEMLLHNRYRHPSLAEGQQVLYAGEIFFNNGNLQWWSNGSGHYQPDADGAEQANLPLDYFYSYQQIIKGEHARKRG